MAKKQTIRLDDEALYDAVTAQAARLGRPLDSVVTEALREWLERQERRDLLPVVEAGRAEWEKHEGVEAGERSRQTRAGGYGTDADAEALIAEFIELDPYRRSLAEARLRGYAVPVWTLVAYWRAADGDVARVAEDYEIPERAVEAALAYYNRHAVLIDDRIASNAF
jgi:uncharacterized protein (DUF433 family)